jgi:hypothetical protein
MILSAAFCAGKKHDFQLFKETGLRLSPHILLLADAGYQGADYMQHSDTGQENKTPAEQRTKNWQPDFGPQTYPD